MPLQPHPRITIDGTSLAVPYSDNYEYDVNGVLMTMKLSLVGVALIDSLPKKLWITPHPDPGQNARAVPVNRLAAQEAGEQTYSCKDASPKLDKDGNPLLGTGEGSDSIIRFSPKEFPNNSEAQGDSSRIPVGVRRDEALFHEMVHSLRQMTGVMDCSPYPQGFDTKDDVFAIMTTNIYSSAFRRPLRKNHVDFEVLSDGEAGSFYRRFQPMVERICQELPVFTRNVAQISYIKFNPFREHYRKSGTL